jgi:16S rRNA (guanine(527)-N(7))-methyltransferase RsmG
VFRDLLLQRVSAFCQLTANQLGQLEQHYELMLRWNKVINLTRIEDEREVIDRHYAESLFLASKLPTGSLRIADLGSGAGFPGVPIAVCRPECSVTLIESHNRKAVFLKESTRVMANVHVEPKRAEVVVENFDWVVSRAVNWETLSKVGFRLAPKLALLGKISPKLNCEAIPIPWSPEKDLLMFHVKPKLICST